MGLVGAQSDAWEGRRDSFDTPQYFTLVIRPAWATAVGWSWGVSREVNAGSGPRETYAANHQHTSVAKWELLRGSLEQSLRMILFLPLPPLTHNIILEFKMRCHKQNPNKRDNHEQGMGLNGSFIFELISVHRRRLCFTEPNSRNRGGLLSIPLHFNQMIYSANHSDKPTMCLLPKLPQEDQPVRRPAQVSPSNVLGKVRFFSLRQWSMKMGFPELFSHRFAFRDPQNVANSSY
ncbi:hypothetical protein VNO77_03279 [Canavalia gladiata]|uniref:Uncharacterized protein n=1 Tax=Canavalia gladiata TaxID=3824 RepID=A0AAN9MV76_CANGL